MKFLFALFCFLYFASSTRAQIFSSFTIKFYYFGGEESYNKTSLSQLKSNPKFSTTKKTVLYFYTVTQSPSSGIVQSMKNAYINFNYNFLLFDLNVVDYSRFSIERITDQLAEAFISLFDAGVNVNEFEIVGVGQGAQFAGKMSRKIKAKSVNLYTISRIFAIEPVTIMFDKLTSSDANFVATIYTEDFISDRNIPSHVSFFVNGGIDQPRCGNSLLLFISNKLCSLKSAQLYWLDAVESQSATIFAARKCNSYENFEENICNLAEPIGYMNPLMSTSLRGSYYLNTRDRKPHAQENNDPLF